MSKKSKALHGVIQLFLILFLLLYLSPLFLVGINAFKSYQEIMTDVMSLPSAFTLDNIKNVFHDMKYPATFLNTLIATVIGTLGIIVIASMGGYKMARVKTRYSRFCFLFCIAPMMIPFQSFMLTLVNVATTLHINGKIWGLAIIYWGLGAPMSIFLYQGFAKGIPLELEESALIDGCNQDCRSWGRSGGYSWLYFTLLYNCNPAGIYLHEIPENVPSPGNSYIPSSGGCGHDRQGRSYHFSIIFFYKWCSGTVSGKHMHSNGGILYCRTGAFEKI